MAEKFNEIGQESTAINCETNKSKLSQELSNLQHSVLKAVASRDCLPQPLFWSLFNSKIKELRERKESLRKIDQLL